MAETDVSVLKYDRETFQLIIDQFPDIHEDLKQLIKDKEDQQENEIFMQNAIKNDETRKLIIKHYNNIINDEKDAYQKSNMTLALKL